MPIPKPTSLLFKAKKWIRLYLSLSEKQLGYANKDITPYMHIMVFHIPYFMAKYRTLKQFSGQGEHNGQKEIILFFNMNW